MASPEAALHPVASVEGANGTASRTRRARPEPGKGQVAIISHAYWLRKFDGNPGAIGSTLRINSETFTVIGVLPPVFDSTPIWSQLDIVRPLTLWPSLSTARDAKWFDIVARLKPGVSLAAAQTELTVLAARLAKEYPVDNGG